MGNKNMDEPCKGDTPAQPRAQALGNNSQYIYWAPLGAAQSKRKANTHAVSAAPKGALNFISLFTQGFISGFALIPPWALKNYRAYGTRKAEV